MDPNPQPLTHAQAEQSAADIIAVARFYDLPLDYFLGVGAMENDYMDVNGDLTHAIWKAHVQTGDIVLQRRRKRVLVSDYSVGAWQSLAKRCAPPIDSTCETSATIRFCRNTCAPHASLI